MNEQSDQTMRSLLGVHRAELSELEAELALVEQNLISSRYVIYSQKDDIERLGRDVERHRQTIKARDEKVAKLQGVVDALKLELAAEREAHTKVRDGAGVGDE